MPVSNSYRAYNTDGTTDPAGSFAYWTDPVFDTAATPNPGHDTKPRPWSMRPAPPGHHQARAEAGTPPPPHPGLPFTRAGCNVGEAGTGEPGPGEQRSRHPEGVSARTHRRRSSWPPTRTRFKDAETADYAGIAVHCAQGSAFCSSARGVKFGADQPQARRAVTDTLPDEPGGYSGYQGPVRPPLRSRRKLGAGNRRCVPPTATR